MMILGIETSCDECSVAVVDDGRNIISNIVASQIELHRPYKGVVPELASRKHTEWIIPVYREALAAAGVTLREVDGIAATNRPGLAGALLVGHSFAKSLAYASGKPFVGVDHIRAHLYAAHLERDIDYPYIGLLVSGGHTILCRVSSFDDVEVLGTTIDDACGEAFDKVAKHYGMGYPGGLAVDTLAARGNPEAFHFPNPSLHKGDHRYDVSYSGLKTAVINQLEQFRGTAGTGSLEDIAASFQKAAIDLLLSRLFRVVEDTGLKRIVAGGGVAANSLLRSTLADYKDVEVIFPSLKLCTDNGAMIAGIGYHYLTRGIQSPFSETVSARVQGFRKTYP
ncbi:MAG: tRNA (adenosine(37)-N6)-threonylcarbamoyltransferase complex transferase subunit TsaD [Spirochaetales bacterium]|nr:tRNA (adenosine(37)-N6)-threonylcarbamoyltransferase complex transferase subunit TsaD [Spirochaetales bacterium]